MLMGMADSQSGPLVRAEQEELVYSHFDIMGGLFNQGIVEGETK